MAKASQLEAALDAAKEKAGGPMALAKLCGVTKGAVSQWSRVPLQHVQTICGLLGVEPSAVRPDIYTPAKKRA